MPELPEVEVTRQGIAQRLEGRTIARVHVGKPLRWPLGIAASKLGGRRFGLAARRGKYLVLPLDTGALIVHLGMSGSLRWRDPQTAPEPHDHLRIDLAPQRGQTAQSLRLNDPRRFGAVVYTEAPHTHPLLAALGPEPLESGFDATTLQTRLAGKRQAIKLALLDQHVVVGVGNIYACEALFLARIHPEAEAGLLRRPALARITRAIQQVLQQAIAQGGSSLRDYVQPDGEMGCFQTRTLVYDREGEPCHTCATPIARITQGQRSTYFCPHCQRG